MRTGNTLDARGLLARQRRGASERVVLVGERPLAQAVKSLRAPIQSRCQLFLQGQDLTLGIWLVGWKNVT